MSQMAAAVAAATVVLLALVGPRHAAAAADKVSKHKGMQCCKSYHGRPTAVPCHHLQTPASPCTPPQPQCLFTGPHISFFGADPYHEQIPAASAATCCYLCAVRMLHCARLRWAVVSTGSPLGPLLQLWSSAAAGAALRKCNVLPALALSPSCRSSASTCRPPAQETPKCVAFEFNEHVGGGTCFLKDSTGVVPRALEGAQSGVLIQPGTTISAEAVHANHAATTGTPAAVLGGAAAAGPPAKGAAAQAERAEGAGGAAAAAGSSGGQGAGPDSVPLLGASLSAASGGAPSSGVSGGELRRRQLQQCTWQGCE